MRGGIVGSNPTGKGKGSYQSDRFKEISQENLHVA